MYIGLILARYAVELLTFISVNLLVTVFVIRSFSVPTPKHPYVATPMDTPDSKQSGFRGLSEKYEGDPNLNLSLTMSTLSESSLDDLGRRPITPDLISSRSTSGSSSSNTTISFYESSASGKSFQMSNTIFRRVGSQSSESDSSPTVGHSASQNMPPIVISPPRQEQLIDGSTPSPSTMSETERIPLGLRTNLAQRLLSLVDSDGRPIRLVKRSALKDITNIGPTRPSVQGGDECIDDAQCLVYRSAGEFLPTLVSTPPTCNAPYSDSSFFGSSNRFGDMFSPNAPPSTTPVFTLSESFKLSNFAGSITRISGDIVTSLATKYQNEYPDDYGDEGVVIGEQFEWEDEMRSLELRLGFYDKAT